MASATVTTVTSTIAENKRKSWNRAYYAKKKLRLLDVEPDAAATAIVAPTDPTAVATPDSAVAMAAITDGLLIIVNVAAAADPWIFECRWHRAHTSGALDGKELSGEAGRQCYPPSRKH
jgi:hypothetical protein